MKIVFLQDDFPPHSQGGAGFSTCDIARGMAGRGHDVSVITTCREGSLAGETDYHGMRIYTIATNYDVRWRAYTSLYNRKAVRNVARILKQIQPDVVHVNNIHTYLSYHSLKLSKRYAKAVVFTARDTMAFTYGKLNTQKYLKEFDAHISWRTNFAQGKKGYNPLRNFFIRRYLRYVDKIVAVSESLARAFADNGIPGVGVIHTGADTDEWNVAESDVQVFKERHGLTNKKIIFFGGRLGEGKGGGKALESFSLIIQKIPDTVLLVAGKENAYTGHMHESADTPDIRSHIVYTGWMDRDALRVAYAASDVVLVPSLYLDPFPRIVIEGMAAGKPVVGSRYGGTPEILEDGATGYVVNPFAVSEMSEKVLALLRDPNQAVRYGEAGRLRIKKFFSIEKTVEAYETLYRSLLDTNSARR